MSESTLTALLKEAVAALETAEAALNNYADAQTNEIGHWVGNDAMMAQMEVHDTLAKILLYTPTPPAQTEGAE